MTSTLRTLRNAGLSRRETQKLLALKQRYARGEISEELTAAERRRLQFTRWMIGQGRLSG